MRPNDRDAASLWDMFQAAREIQEFIQDLPYDKFKTDKMRRYAVERQLTVLGEAAGRISEAFKLSHPEILWERIIAQRNVIAHEYGEILIERIWRVATERIPELLRLLEVFVPAPPQD